MYRIHKQQKQHRDLVIIILIYSMVVITGWAACTYINSVIDSEACQIGR